MKKVRFIYNPYSGDKTISDKLDIIIETYQSKGYVVIPFRISNRGKIEDAFLDIDNTYDHILIAGGDGTVDIVVNNIKKLNMNIPIAVLPTGTANDFANMINMSSNIEYALEQIINSTPKKIDLGKINDSYFVNIASAGMFTDVSQKIDPILKNSLGRISYLIKGAEEAVNLKHFKVSVKSKEIIYEGQMYLILIFNGSTAGNINLAHSSKIDDGLLDVIIFKPMPISRIIKLLGNLVKNIPIENCKDVIYFKTSELFVDCKEKINTDIDGERGPDFPLNIYCELESISVLGILDK